MSVFPEQDYQQSSSPPIRGIFIVLALSTVTRGLMLYYRLIIQGYSPENLVGSDVAGWLGMARHLQGGLDFSYWLMGVRPPFFPMTVAAVYALGGNNYHAAILQTMFGILTPVVGYWLAYRLLAVTRIKELRRAALLAGIVMALDPASISASATLLSEPLFNLLFTLFLLSLIVYIQKQHWLDLALGGLWLALTMLTRPTAIYFWVFTPIIVIPLVKKWWQPTLALACVGLLVFMGWSVRNYRYTGVFTYSLQTNFTLLFLRASSAEHLATGKPIDEVYVENVRELYLRLGDPEAAANAGPEHLWRFHVARSPEVYNTMGQLAREKLREYWQFALLGTGIGAARMFGITNLLPDWSIPLEILYHLLLYGLAAYGAWQAFRRKSWQILLATGVPIFYVTGLTLASQTSAMDTRMRTSIAVPIIILAVYGLTRFLERFGVER